VQIFDYDAKLGLGVVFKAKTFVFENDKNVYLVSPGPLSEEFIDSLKEKNKELHFISPNGFHHIHLKKCKSLFPDAKFYGGKRAQKQSGLELTPLSEIKDEEFVGCKIEGNKMLGEYCFYLPGSKELIVTDLAFNYGTNVTFMTKIALLSAGVYNKLGTSKLVKFSITDKKLFKKSLESLFSLDFEVVHLNHGDSVTKEEFKRHMTKAFKLFNG
jgi:hypothetical protein